MEAERKEAQRVTDRERERENESARARERTRVDGVGPFQEQSSKWLDK